MSLKIPYVNLSKQWQREKRDLLKFLTKFYQEEIGLGSEIEKFEEKLKVCKTQYAIALNSGTDALTLGLHMLNVKKEMK